MKIIQLTLMAFRYFQRYFRRYLFLFIALSFGFGVITVITGIQEGMSKNLYLSAKSHYAGDMALVGRAKSRIKFQINDVDKVRSLLEASGVRYDHIVTRTQFGGNGTVYFNGTAIPHKYILGVDWDDEVGTFEGMTYAQGSYGGWNEDNGILLSSPVAEQLNARIGDQVLLEVYTRTGQVNTESFVVQAVVEDYTIFGYYKCYVNRSTLNHMIGFSENEASTIGIYMQKGAHLNLEAEKLQKALEEAGMNTAPLVSDRNLLEKEYAKKWLGTRFFVVTLPVYLSEVSDLLDAINMIAYFLYLLMLIIIIVSVGVTFRLILHEREKEIGTLRGIGFHERDIVFLLMLETMFLFLCSLVTGFLFGSFIIELVSMFKFDAIPSIEIFMQDGKIDAVFTLRTVLINCCIVLLVLFPTVALPVYWASRKPMAIVLSGGKG